MNLIINLINGILYQFHRFKPELWTFDIIIILAGAILIWKRENNIAFRILKLVFWSYLVILFSGTIFMRRPRKTIHFIII